MKHKFISQTVGKRLVIVGGVVMSAATLYIFVALRPTYGVNTCNEGGPCDGIDLGGLAFVFSIAVYAVVLTAFLIISGVIIMHAAKKNKENAK